MKKAKENRKNRTTTAGIGGKSYRSLSELQNDRDIWYRLCVLVYDLHNFKNNKLCENRTLQTTDPLYISAPYFSQDEAAIIKAILVDDGNTSVEEAITSRFQSFFEKRRASGDCRPCGPHDMVPIYLECFGMQKGEIEDEKLVPRVGRSGLGRP